MAELPKIVKSRLAQQRSADHAEHPDANLLSAFAEQTLLERERMAVSAHLAQCADCRESLALAGMAPPVAERVTISTKRHWLLEWRWVGAAAAACCVIAVVLQYRVQPSAIERAKYTVASPAGAATAPQPERLPQRIAVAPKLTVEHLKKAQQLPPPSLAREQSPPSLMTQVDSSAPERNPAVVAIRPAEPPAPSGLADILQPRIEPESFRAEPSETARGSERDCGIRGEEWCAAARQRVRSGHGGSRAIGRGEVPLQNF